MRIDIVFPALPPLLDGIGDHTARMAQALADRCEVRVLTAQTEFDRIPGVSVERAFSIDRPRGVARLYDAVRAAPPDWLILQFNQFSYGRWGLNPFLPLVVHQILRDVPSVRLAWFAHEDYVPPTSWRFVVMRIWQKWQFRKLGEAAHLIFFSIEPWVMRYAPLFPGKPVRHLPVASNIPRIDLSRQEARARIGIDHDVFVIGVFGTANASRMLPLIRRGASVLFGLTESVLLLYVGPNGARMKSAFEGLPFRDAGALSAEDVSTYLLAMDLHLAPFADGVSTRRGSFMAGIQHGVPTVSTMGDLTDNMLKRADGDAFLLAPVSDPAAFEERVVQLYVDSARRDRMRESSSRFYESNFSVHSTSTRLLDALCEVE